MPLVGCENEGDSNSSKVEGRDGVGEPKAEEILLEGGCESSTRDVRLEKEKRSETTMDGLLDCSL